MKNSFVKFWIKTTIITLVCIFCLTATSTLLERFDGVASSSIEIQNELPAKPLARFDK